MKRLVAAVIPQLPPEFKTRYRLLAGDATATVGFCNDVWNYFNVEKFQGRMTRPNIRLARDMGSSTHTRAFWQRVNRRIQVTPMITRGPIDSFVEVFLHEMCHQAVSEIDQVFDPTEGGHGNNWQQWMVRVGLAPFRFDFKDNEHYKTTYDKKGRKR